MPSLDFTLPHWLYWVGLVVFPLAAMVLARRTRPDHRSYGLPLGYLILVTGGMLGLHRFYVKNVWGIVFIPIFIFVLYANGIERDAREEVSDAANAVRVAERTLSREEPRVTSAEAELESLRAEVAAAEEGSFTKRAAERRLSRAEQRIVSGRERLAEAEAELEAARPAVEAATERRAFWGNAARTAFFAILALMAIDALLLPRLVQRANATIPTDPTPPGQDEAAAAAESNKGAAAVAEIEERKADEAYAENWIDRLALYAGEFVAYWAVIAVFVYYYEVIARYVFNSPTNWAHEAMYLMFGMQYLIAGAYAMLTEAHVRVDIFYAPLSRPRKAWADLVTSIFFFIFAGTLLVTSYIFAMDALAVPTGNALISAWARDQITFGTLLSEFSLRQWSDPNIRWGEISFNEWEVPLWPMKWMMVVGGLLLVLQGVSKVAKDIRAIARESERKRRTA